MTIDRRTLLASVAAMASASFPALVNAQARGSSPGVTDTEIKLGNTNAASGPSSVFGVMGRLYVAYFDAVNEKGGINGRKVRVISLDDANSPPKAVEMTRKLVEEEQVLAIFGSTGTAPAVAVQKYMNARKVPQLFFPVAAEALFNPKDYPWTVPLAFAYHNEGEAFARHIRQTRPNAKIAMLSQNDVAGRAYVNGFRKGLGDKVSQIVKEETYELSDPQVDSQIVSLHGSGADTFANFSIAKFTSQAIRKVDSIGWKPYHVIGYVSSSITSTLAPVGLDKAVGLVTTVWVRTPSADLPSDPAFSEYLAFMKARLPREEPGDYSVCYAYAIAVLMRTVLERCGNDLSRENVLRQVTGLKDVQLPTLLPGVTVGYSPTDYSGVRQARLARFDGTRWVPFGEPVTIGS